MTELINDSTNLSGLPKTRKEAKIAGETYYFTGKPCPRGHCSERETNSSHCMDCRRAKAPEKRAYVKKWRENNPDKTRRYHERRVSEKKHLMDEYQAAYRRKHAERLIHKERRYRKENKKVLSAKDVARKRERRKKDPAYACIHRMRSRASYAYAGKFRPARTMELIGCTAEEFRLHMESQFKPGMSWDNRSEWHIDHIVPISAFDLEDPEQAKAAFHWSNCQPLWAEENLRKGTLVESTPRRCGAR